MPTRKKNFIHWSFTEYYFKSGTGFLKLIATLYGIFQPIAFTQPIWEEYQCCMPLPAAIAIYIVIWGFLIGIILHTYELYKPRWWRKLKK